MTDQETIARQAELIRSLDQQLSAAKLALLTAATTMIRAQADVADPAIQHNLGSWLMDHVDWRVDCRVFENDDAEFGGCRCVHVKAPSKVGAEAEAIAEVRRENPEAIVECDYVSWTVRPADVSGDALNGRISVDSAAAMVEAGREQILRGMRGDAMDKRPLARVVALAGMMVHDARKREEAGT